MNETTQKNLWTKSEDIIGSIQRFVQIFGSIEIAAQKALEENLSEIQETPVIPEKISDSSSSDSDEPEIIEEIIKEEQNAKVIQVNISTDNRTDVWSRPSCIYTQIFSPKKNWFFPHKKYFPNFF